MRRALVSMLGVLRRDAAELGEQPHAVVGGVAGLLLTLLAVWGVGSLAPAREAPIEDIELPFFPGTIARLGTSQDAPPTGGEPSEVPEPASPEVVPPVSPPSTHETVTTDADAAPTPPKTDPPRERPPTPPKRGGSKLPGPPNPDTKGDPFGDPDGWDDLTRAGDEWATSVVKELSRLEVGWYAGKAEDGEFHFQISVCKNGEISDVRKKGGDLSQDGQGKVLLALEQLQLPAPPKHVRDRMTTGCAKIQHTFVWTPRGVH